MEELLNKYLSIDIDIEYEGLIQLLINECFNFISVIINIEYAENLNKSLIFPFINGISNLIFIDKQQENMIKNDPNLFVATEKDNDDEVTTLRGKAIQTIEMIIEMDIYK